MDDLQIVLIYLFIVSLFAVLTIFVGYPLFLWIKGLGQRQKTSRPGLSEPECEPEPEQLPSASIIIAVRNGEQLICDKINNCLALNYPQDLLDIIVFSDGSTDQTMAQLHSYKEPRLILLSSAQHVGKANALNLAVRRSQAELLFFSDADAMLQSNALRHLAAKLASEQVGGVSGLRVIEKEKNDLKAPQKTYIKLDSWIKIQESRQGSTTSNDGKLYGIKRALFKPIAQGVTDDLYSALSIVTQGKRFVFEPLAIAHIKTPSRNMRHEIIRRRRITCRSMHGLFLNRQLLNPINFGRYAIALFINKILRRFLPLFLLLLFVSSLLLVNEHPLFLASFFTQLAIYAMPLITRLLPIKNSRMSKLSNVILYFTLGNLGMLLGLYDFAVGKKVVKWEPLKND